MTHVAADMIEQVGNKILIQLFLLIVWKRWRMMVKLALWQRVIMPSWGLLILRMKKYAIEVVGKMKQEGCTVFLVPV